MAVRENAKKHKEAEPSPEFPMDGNLVIKFQRITEQTGLSSHDLLQKWILQEESLIGLIRHSKGQVTEQAEISPDVFPQQDSDAQKQKESAGINSDSPNYRKMLVKRAIKLRKGGMTLKKIAETFNEEKATTLSGTGKWYASSITNLLKSKA